MRPLADEVWRGREPRSPVDAAVRQVRDGQRGREGLHRVGKLARAVVIGDDDRQR